MLIHKQIIAIMSDVKSIAKTQQGDGFQFRGIDDVQNALHPLFQKHKIFCTTETTAQSHNNAGKTIIEAKFSFYAEDGSCVSSTTRGESIDKGEHGTAKALSVAQRIALVQMFMIPTADGLPFLTPHLYKKAHERIKAGDFQLYFKLELQYRLTNDQKEELRKLINAPIPNKLTQTHNECLNALCKLRGMEAWIGDRKMKELFQETVYPTIDKYKK